MVDLGQTGGRDSACLILKKKPTAFTIGFIRNVELLIISQLQNV